MVVLDRAGDSDSVRRVHAAAESTKDGGKPDLATGMLGASLTEARPGKALSDRPALEPYRGKPALRNLRGGDGNVGIIRSPLRAIALPDQAYATRGSRERRVLSWPEHLATNACRPREVRPPAGTATHADPRGFSVRGALRVAVELLPSRTSAHRLSYRRTLITSAS
jgi:hypothetical protein